MCVLGICSSCVARRASRVAFADVAMLCREYTSRMKGTCPQDCSKLKERDLPVEWILDPNNSNKRNSRFFQLKSVPRFEKKDDEELTPLDIKIKRLQERHPMVKDFKIRVWAKMLEKSWYKKTGF
ncbi:PREDICTED: uncharacterized protein LOC107331807 isoform X2 [Acropora digitifera]|uniref:uncharacterized protein LOC107331807 isoform X2 n=1 Tax=Acropora digitifera TaxID=70779 RepID=UPI00077A1C4D|nr:PREDICTED: uncharacterized protein LOC107331807 isoform X2 [Acropora digitifera]